MPARVDGGLLLLFALGLLVRAGAQQTPVRGDVAAVPPQWVRVEAGLWRDEGTEPWSRVRYLRFLLLANGRAPEDGAEATPDAMGPALLGQCTQEAQGKLRFELFVNFGGVTDLAFYPPWHSRGQDDLFAPATKKVMLKMEFLGYTKVKPYTRQFEEVVAPEPLQLRYMNPGRASANMEPPGWFFQYLRVLPTLRLSGDGRQAEFATGGWLARMRSEALCGASGA